MTSGFSMDFSSVANGEMMDLVATVKVFDTEHTAHLMVTRGGLHFLYDGCLNEGFTAYTMFQVCLHAQFPMPKVSATKDTVILGHQHPSWSSFHSVIDLCSGFGGLAQGAVASGFEVVVAVDQNQKMLDLHSKANGAHCICGDFGSRDVIHQVWQHSRGASIVSSGFSCQPYSRLGDCKGQLDSRSSCLTKTLDAAYFLNASVIILECVAPAAHDAFIQAELLRFCTSTGYRMSHTDLKLDQIWPCRRHRAWWILYAPELGTIDLATWAPLDNLWEVQQIIPEISLWAENDENLLALDEVELEAFGVTTDNHAKYLLNGKSTAPCALHAWGSQTRACPCGCRQQGFSCHRLESKGLHGCIVRSAVSPDGTTRIRHLHPNEVMGLNTMDPVVDFGEDVRLTLSAVGQLACPVQALWIFGHVEEKLALMRQMPSFDANAQIQAFRSWILMRCRQVWPCKTETIQDTKLLAMMQFWNEFRDVSLPELLFPLRWNDSIDGHVSIASVLDHLIRSKERVPPTVCDPETAVDVDATPWMDFPELVDDPTTAGCMMVDSCTVVFEGSGDSPIRFQPKCNATLKQFIDAQAKLVGDVQVISATMNGTPVGLDHVMEVAQVIVVTTCPLSPVQESCQVERSVSPTAEWTQPIQDPIEVDSPPRKVSKFDVGECTIPKTSVQDQPWLDASPFLNLQGEQFLKLSLPSLTNVQQLWSVRHQFFRTEDRMKIFDAQGPLMADDEIRFHLHALTLVHRDHQLKFSSTMTQVRVIDPLLASAWVHGKGFDCALWAKDHPEIRQQSMLVITAVLVNQHWIPVFMSPVKDVLQVFTWDGQDACHDTLNRVIQRVAVGLGFAEALINREHRLFFSSDQCGALAIAFIRYALVGTSLPADRNEAEAVHTMLRALHIQTLLQCQITDRPWVWGAGDADPTARPDPAQPALLNITRDDRIDLINAKGFAMADDEIRFHIVNLITNQEIRNPLMGRTFVFFEPLVYSCWSSIGKTITEQWCARHMEVRTHGLNIVTAFSVEDHWIPLWFSPRGNCLQIHTFQQEAIDFRQVEEILEFVSDYLDFLTFAVHKIPVRLPAHVMCGAHSLAFIAHVIMNMPLPDSLEELRTPHTNMRASFVAHLYSVEVTPQPVVWGNGPKRMSEPHSMLPADLAEISTTLIQEVASMESGIGEHQRVTPCSGNHSGESGLLPRMPATAASQPSMPTSRGAVVPRRDVASSSSSMPIDQSVLDARLLQVTSHSFAMSDDEILFQLRHIVSCQAQPVDRVFLILPPLFVTRWFEGDDAELRTWIEQHRDVIGQPGHHILCPLLLAQHWIPVWLAPSTGGMMAHTFADFASDDTEVERILHLLVHKCGSALLAVHRVPHGLVVDRLCGVMTVSFIAHIVLGTRVPRSFEELTSRCWSMKEVFVEELRKGCLTFPVLWGWGLQGESRLLPIMPVWESPLTSFAEACGVLPAMLPAVCNSLVGGDTEDPITLGMTMHEMSHHMNLVRDFCQVPIACEVVAHLACLADKVSRFLEGDQIGFACSILQNMHWSPLLIWKSDLRIVIAGEDGPHLSLLADLCPDGIIFALPVCPLPSCGTVALMILAQGVLGFRCPHDILAVRGWLNSLCPHIALDGDLVGFGPSSLLLQNLCKELLKHGIPEHAVEDRAKSAIKVLGSEQIMTALGHRQPWRQLKALGNHSKFQSVLPTELADAVESNKGKTVAPKGKGKGKIKPPPALDLDPGKLQVLEGTFRTHDRILPQLSMKQIGPISSGFILMSLQDAEPYLKSGRVVSQEPLALVVLHAAGSHIQTALPHATITVPCRCTVNSEPVLAEAVIVQVGSGLVEKAAGGEILDVDTPEVVTLKLLVYKDELQLDWEEFCRSPIKCLVSLLPMLKRCEMQDCGCSCWHNVEQLPIRDPILDVWRRQFLRQGFKPCPPAQAEFFSVCMRIPQCLLETLLAASGTSGAYCEPRTADGKEILAAYTVVWTPKHTLQEMQHLRQTNPAVTGLARLGDRRGLRVRTEQAKTIHQLVRPDSVYLPNGPKCQYSVGPFPYGADRQAVCRMLQKAGWECRALQPSTPCPGRGVLWLVQSTEEPAQTIIPTSLGEIMITKVKQEMVNQAVPAMSVGSAATLALCGKQGSAPSADCDPWAASDPWQTYKPLHAVPAGPQEGIQQLEDRIQTAVLAKIQQPMDQDDLPDRVHTLEGQVQQLLHKQQGLEVQFHDHSSQHTQQINALQNQVTAQAQQLHGHLENQNQTMQSLFEQQMQQIRGLLAKRPREDAME